MTTQKYSVNQHLIETILSWVKSGEIAIPEIQRPFVWEAIKVRDFIDSLYQGYPVGYIIAWRNPNVRLKDGALSEGKKILIDGQQRVTALTAAILSNYVINKEYRRVKIKISFNPIEERFEVFNMAIARNKIWISDISEVFNPDNNVLDIVDSYCQSNEDVDRNGIFEKIENLKKIVQKQIGLIELDSDLDIEIVTEIFIRINSKGVTLSQADFAMSKIASNETYGGSELRRCIDYFCHMAKTPEFYNQIVDIDSDFTKTDYFNKMSWLKNENDELYDPKYTDLLRVAFTSEFGRGKLSDLVSLLSGRNFETRTYEESIAQESFEKLKNGIMNFMNETNFKRFVMIIRSAGFISTKLIRSQNALNFAYIIYLKLKSQNYNSADIESYVRKWFVMSILTGRYSGSAESMIDYDIKNIGEKNFSDYLKSVESAELSDAYWDFALLQSLDTSVSSSPTFNVYLAAQVKLKDKGFLSRDITIADLIELRGDIHHIFPKDYLKKQGFKRGKYNQVANYVYMQSEINIRVGNKAPHIYFQELKEQCNGGGLNYGGIDNIEVLLDNLKANCISDKVFDMDINDYQEFLDNRRLQMSKKMKEYYFSL
ncbi:MAG: DUF262 domain-containing protein [Chlorobi bacterium]|nr:DUF262 domain-containing protein [Chlorobiota bacterium]